MFSFLKNAARSRKTRAQAARLPGLQLLESRHLLAVEALVLWDTAVVGNPNAESLFDAMEEAGIDVTVSAVRDWSFNGTNHGPEPLSNFDVVIHLDGNFSISSQGSVNRGMQDSGQLALVDFVQNGGGYIHTELQGFWNSRTPDPWYNRMSDLILFDSSSIYSVGNWQGPTYTKVVDHPILENMPDSFSLSTYYTNSRLRSFATEPATVVMRDTRYSSAADAVAVREFGSGRVVGMNHMGHAESTSANPPWNTLQHPALQKLFINSVYWSSGDEGAPTLDLNGTDTGTGSAGTFTEDAGPVSIVETDVIADDPNLSSVVPGDIYMIGNTSPATVVRVDPLTGDQQAVASGGELTEILLAMDRDSETGDIFVGTYSTGKIVRLTPSLTGPTYDQTLVTTLGGAIWSLSYAGDNQLTLGVTLGGSNQIIRYDLDTLSIVWSQPAQTSSGGALTPYTVATEWNGTTLYGGSGNAIYQISDAGDFFRTLSVQGSFQIGVAAGPLGQVYALDFSTRQVFEIDRLWGGPRLITTIPSGASVRHIAVEADGNLLVSDVNSDNLYRIDPATGDTTVVTNGGLIPFAWSIATDEGSAGLHGATAAITNRVNGSEEVLAVDTTGTSLTSSFNAATGVLTIDGFAPKSVYEQVLATLTYDNASQDPTAVARIVEITVNDGTLDSEPAIATVNVVPVNDPPVLTVGPLTVNEGEAFTRVIATWFDPEAADVPNSTWVNWGEGPFVWRRASEVKTSARGGEISGTWTYQDNGVYTVSVWIYDASIAYDTTTFQMTVLNVDPTASISGDTMAVPGMPLTLSFEGDDVSPVDAEALLYEVDFGDGSDPVVFTDAAGLYDLTHAYATTGDYTVSLTVTDKDGGTVTTTEEVTVVPVFVDSNGNLQVGGTELGDRITIVPSGTIGARVDTDFGRFILPLPDASDVDVFVYGQEGDDTIRFFGRAPGDWRMNFFGGEGSDYLAGGVGNDLLDGGEGDDRLLAGPGDNQLFGGPGNDQLSAEDGHDWYDAGDGNDRVSDRGGDNFVHGGAGDDRIAVGAGSDILIGGDGDDNLSGQSGNDLLMGGEGDDLLYAGSGEDLIAGGIGRDRILGDAGVDLAMDGTTLVEDASLFADMQAYQLELEAAMAEWESGLMSDLMTRLDPQVDSDVDLIMTRRRDDIVMADFTDRVR